MENIKIPLMELAVVRVVNNFTEFNILLQTFNLPNFNQFAPENVENTGKIFIYSRQQNMPLTISIFGKPIIAELYHTEIFCAEFYSTRSRNV